MQRLATFGISLALTLSSILPGSGTQVQPIEGQRVTTPQELRIDACSEIDGPSYQPQGCDDPASIRRLIERQRLVPSEIPTWGDMVRDA